MGEDFRELMFLGLSKNMKVCANAIYKQQGLCRLTETAKGAFTYAIYCRILTGRDGHLDQSKFYDIS